MKLTTICMKTSRKKLQKNQTIRKCADVSFREFPITFAFINDNIIPSSEFNNLFLQPIIVNENVRVKFIKVSMNCKFDFF